MTFIIERAYSREEESFKKDNILREEHDKFVEPWTGIVKSVSQNHSELSRMEMHYPSINNVAYVKTFLHKHSRNSYVGGVTINDNYQQKKVIEKLSSLSNVKDIFMNHENTKDKYTIIIDGEKKPDFSLDLAEMYWELYDDFLYPDNTYSYDFEFQYFHNTELPELINFDKLVYSRRS